MFKFLDNLFSGRIGRTGYIIGSIMILFLFTSIAISFFSYINYFHINVPELVYLLLCLPFIIAYCALSTKRYHDFGESGWQPLKGGWFWFAGLALVLRSGDKKKNKYGKPPSF